MRLVLKGITSISNCCVPKWHCIVTMGKVDANKKYPEARHVFKISKLHCPQGGLRKETLRKASSDLNSFLLEIGSWTQGWLPTAGSHVASVQRCYAKVPHLLRSEGKRPFLELGIQ